MTVTSVLVVDDDQFFGQGLVDELARMAGVRVLGRVGSLEELPGDATPDVVLLDLGLPGTCRRAATGEVLARWPDARVLVITAYASATDLVLAFSEGARGYVAKTIDPDELEGALRAVAAGRSYVTPTLAGHLLNLGLTLTPGERAVLRQVAEGLSDRQVAAALGIAEKTVENRLSSVRTKAGLAERSRAEITRFAIEADSFCQLPCDDHAKQEGDQRRIKQAAGQRRGRRRAAGGGGDP